MTLHGAKQMLLQAVQKAFYILMSIEICTTQLLEH